MIPMTVGDTTGLNIISYDFQVTYNPAVLQPSGGSACTGNACVQQTGTLSAGMLVTPNTGNAGHFIMSAFQANPLAGAGTLIYLKFDVVGAPGTQTPLTFEDYSEPNGNPHAGFVWNEGDPPAFTTNGSVTVGGAPTFTSTATATATFTPTASATSTLTGTPSPTPTSSPEINGVIKYANAVGVTPRFVSNVAITAIGSPMLQTTSAAGTGAYGFTGLGPGSYTVVAAKSGRSTKINSYDAGKIALHVGGFIVLNETALAAADVSGSETVSSLDATFVARYSVNTTLDTGNTGIWRFYAVENIPFPVGTTPTSRTYSSVTSAMTGQNFSALLLGDVSGNWLNNGARPAKPGGPERAIAIALPRVAETVGKEIVVPMSVQDVADKEVISYEFDLRYDPAVLQPSANPVDLRSTVSRGLNYVFNAEEPGLLRVAVYGPMPINTNGVLLNLKFTSVGNAGAMSPLTIERVMFNEGDPWVIKADGQVELSEAER